MGMRIEGNRRELKAAQLSVLPYVAFCFFSTYCSFSGASTQLLLLLLLLLLLTRSDFFSLFYNTLSLCRRRRCRRRQSVDGARLVDF